MTSARTADVKTLYADEHMLVIDKPAGMFATYVDDRLPSLPRELARAGVVGAAEELLLVGRVDPYCSGLLILARGRKAAEPLATALREDRIERVWLALVNGYVLADGEANEPLAFRKSSGRWQTARRGRAARTAFRVADRVAGHTLLECRQNGDVPDQSRAHLAFVGHPLAVDPDYGGAIELRLSDFKSGYRPNRRGEERPLLARLSLHVCRIAAPHPVSGEVIAFESPVPRDLRATLAQLRRLKSRA